LLLLSADTRELARVDAPTRLERLAQRLGAPSDAIGSWVMQPAHGWQTVPARVDRGLRALEETFAPGAGATEGIAHARA
jgi:hypothetical protein